MILKILLVLLTIISIPTYSQSTFECAVQTVAGRGFQKAKLPSSGRVEFVIANEYRNPTWQEPYSYAQHKVECAAYGTSRVECLYKVARYYSGGGMSTFRYGRKSAPARLRMGFLLNLASDDPRSFGFRVDCFRLKTEERGLEFP